MFEEGSCQNGLGGVPSVRVSFFFLFSTRAKFEGEEVTGCNQLGTERKVVDRGGAVDERDSGFYVVAGAVE